MKRWTRKLLAGLLSFGMLLQAASPLSALAADGNTQSGALTIWWSNELLATANPEADGTLNWENGYNPFESVQIEYDATSKTYKFEGMLTPPKNGYMTIKTDSAEDSIYIDGSDQKAVNGTVYIGTEESPIKNVTITSSNSEATVKEQAVIRATGDVKLFNTGGGQVAEQAASDCKARSVSIVGGSSTVPTAGVLIWVEDASGNVSIVNNEEDGLVAGGRVRVKADGNVDIKGGIAKTSRESTKSDIISGGKVTFDANASSANALKDMSLIVTAADAVTLKSHSSNSFLSGEKAYIDVTAPSLTVGNDGSGVIDGTVKFTRTDTTSAYRVAVGESESSNTQTALTDTTYSATVNAKYLNIQPGTPETTDSDDKVTNYGITVTMNHGEAIGVTSNNCGNILGDTYTNGKLTYDPESHTLTGTGTFGKLKINITAADSVDVKLSNDAGGIVVDGSLTVDGAQNVTVVSKNAADSDSFGTVVCGDVTINCTGNILLENEGTGDVIGGSSASRTLKVVKAHDVTIRGVCNANESTKATYTIFGSAEIDCTGNAEITSDTFVAVKTDLTVNGAQNVTISGNQDSGATIGGAADISCSGTVTLENKGSGKAVRGELKYTPTHTQKYEIKTGAAAASAETFYTGESGTGYTGAFNDPYISIAPASSGGTTLDDTGTVDSGSDAGGAVAAVLMGGAAVWGGYEIATRVILHNILPEGAAIPANRGQLALLVWNNAGRSEPAAQPAFADVADADMAKAAQWCVEQGIMEAKTAETFKPEGWMPKLKVIEIWNKAFPKQ